MYSSVTLEGALGMQTGIPAGMPLSAGLA